MILIEVIVGGTKYGGNDPQHVSDVIGEAFHALQRLGRLYSYPLLCSLTYTLHPFPHASTSLQCLPICV